MIRAFVLYEGDVDPERYQQHIDEFVSPIPATFRHGKVVRRPVGDGAALPLLRRVRVSGHGRRSQQVATSPEFARHRARTRRRWASRSRPLREIE